MDIQIDIKDERHFCDVAPVVDREDFAKEIERIRSVLEIKLPLDEKYFSLPLSKSKEKQIETEIETRPARDTRRNQIG